MLDTIVTTLRFIGASFRFLVWWLILAVPITIAQALVLHYVTSGLGAVAVMAVGVPLHMFATMRGVVAFDEAWAASEPEEEEDAE